MLHLLISFWFIHWSIWILLLSTTLWLYNTRNFLICKCILLFFSLSINYHIHLSISIPASIFPIMNINLTSTIPSIPNHFYFILTLFFKSSHNITLLLRIPIFWTRILVLLLLNLFRIYRIHNWNLFIIDGCTTLRNILILIFTLIWLTIFKCSRTNVFLSILILVFYLMLISSIISFWLNFHFIISICMIMLLWTFLRLKVQMIVLPFTYMRTFNIFGFQITFIILKKWFWNSFFINFLFNRFVLTFLNRTIPLLII